MTELINELGSREEYIAATAARLARSTPGASEEYRRVVTHSAGLCWDAHAAFLRYGAAYLRFRESQGEGRARLQSELDEAKAAHQRAVDACNAMYAEEEGLRRRDAGEPGLWHGLRERPPAVKTPWA